MRLLIVPWGVIALMLALAGCVSLALCEVDCIASLNFPIPVPS